MVSYLVADPARSRYCRGRGGGGGVHIYISLLGSVLGLCGLTLTHCTTETSHVPTYLRTYVPTYRLRGGETGAKADSIEALLAIGREGHSDLVSVVASTLEVTRRTGMRPGDEAGHVRSMAALFHQEGEFALERTLRERAVALLQSEVASEAAAVGAAYDASECPSAGALAESRIELQDLLGEHLGQKEEARVLLAAALDSAIEAFGGDDPRVAQILCRQGEQLWKKREGSASVEEALGLFEEAHRIFEYCLLCTTWCVVCCVLCVVRRAPCVVRSCALCV